MNRTGGKRKSAFPPKDNPKLTPGQEKVQKESKKKVVYDRVIVFDFAPTPDYGFVYSLSKAQTEKSGVTDKELNHDVFRLRNREQRRQLNIWSPPHNHLLIAKVDSRE